MQAAVAHAAAAAAFVSGCVENVTPFASQLFVGFFSSALKYLVLLYFHNNHNHTLPPPPPPHSTTTDVCSKRK